MMESARRIYTPDDTGHCMVCGRPGGEHSRSAGWDDDPALCPPAELAARRCETDAVIGGPVEVVDVDLIAPATDETVTREQIRELLRTVDPRSRLAHDCDMLLDPRIEAALARVVAAIRESR